MANFKKTDFGGSLSVKLFAMLKSKIFKSSG